MELPHDFIHKILGILVPEVPKEPTKVTDDAFKKIMQVNGGHQRVISVSRCARLSPSVFDMFRICKGLIFLNISYTSITDFSPLRHCEVLRALLVAGVQCTSYDDLHALTSLELLNLTFSSISRTDMLDDLIRLRSLDLGSTRIRCLDKVERLTRLEELMIDSNSFTESSAQHIPQQLQQLPNLRVVHVGDTLLSFNRDLLLSSSAGWAVQWTSRVQKWFEAVVANDSDTVGTLIANGFDVNLRIAPSEQCPNVTDMLVQTWRSRCQGTAPYFDLHHPKLRPSAVHLAVYFNSIDCLRLLIQSQAEVACSVWLGNVRLDELELPGGTETMQTTHSTDQHTNKLRAIHTGIDSNTARSVIDMAKRVFELNIHRLTENMTERRIRDWKVLCKEHMNTIISVVNNSPTVAENSDNNDPLSEVPEFSTTEESAPADSDATPVTSTRKQSSNIAPSDVRIKFSVESEPNESMVHSTNEGCGSNHDECRQMSFQSDENSSKMQSVCPSRTLLSLRNNHPMIQKLHIPYEPLGCPGVKIMGRRTYWLESRADTLAKELIKPRVAKPVLEARNIDKLAPVAIASRYLRHPVPQDIRKQRFLIMLKSRRDL